MNQTYINLLVSDIESRWEEINILLESAEENRNNNVSLHDAICRSVSILMVANLEGFYKELVRNIIDDLNRNNDFHQLPKAIKRSYCLNFIDQESSSKAVNAITEKLIVEFDRLNANIDYKPFLYDRNKNPKSSVIKNVFQNLGLNKVFKILESSKYEVVFQEENSYLERVIPTYISELTNSSQSFPYKWQESCFDFECPNQNNSKTLWELFLEEVNRRRHEIAHGNDSNNVDSVQELKKIKNKLMCLQIALIHILIERFGVQDDYSSSQ